MVHEFSDAIPIESDLLRLENNRVGVGCTLYVRRGVGTKPVLVNPTAHGVAETGM